MQTLPWLTLVLVLPTIMTCAAVEAAGEDAPIRAVALQELWRIGGDTQDANEIFGVITDVCLDAEGNLYVVDRQLSRISVFDAAGAFLRTIGREGDGPGEFRRPYRVFVTPGGEVRVLASRFGLVSRFSLSGEYLGEIPLPADADGVVPAIRDVKESPAGPVAWAVVRENTEFVLAGERVEKHLIGALDDLGRLGRAFFGTSFTGDDAYPVWSERPGALNDRWDVAPDGRVVVATSFLDYSVAVFGPDGAEESRFTIEYDHRRRSKNEKQAILDWATVNPDGNLPGTRFEIEDWDKDVMALFCRPGGEIWILTSRGVYDRPTGSVGVFDVRDRAGDLKRRVSLEGDADPTRDRFVFAGDRLYVLTCFRSALATMIAGGADNRFSRQCDEPMGVVCYRVGGAR